MLSGELVGRNALSGEIQKQVIAVGGGDAPIKTISVDGVKVEPDSKKNVDIDLSGKADVDYVDRKVADLVNSAPETLDTLGEVAKAIQENESVVDALNGAIGSKLDKVTTPYGTSVHRIYAVGTQGQQYVITTVDSNNIVETKKHSEETYVAQQKPEFDAGATRGYAYVIEQEKNSETGEFEQFQRVKKIQIQANADTIPLRNPSGNFYVGNPTLPYECTNLGTITAKQGTSAPTEDTKALYVGELYYDTTNNKMYMCFGIDTTNKKYTWTQIIRETDYAGNSIKGVVDVRSAFGMSVDQYGRIYNVLADEATISGKTDIYKAITANKIDYAVKQGLAYSKLAGTGFAWTDGEKASARELLGINTLIGDINTALEAILGV